MSFSPSYVGAACNQSPQSPQSQQSVNKYRVFLEGNIGAGKSCLAACLSSRGYICTPEPIKLWDRVLSLYYQDPVRFAFNLQNTVASTISNNITLVERRWSDEKVLVFERSLESTSIFTQNCKKNGFLTDTQAQTLVNTLSCFKETLVGTEYRDVYVYLQCEPSICAQRIQKRNRRSETSNQSFLSSDMRTYLQDIHRFTRRQIPTLQLSVI